MQIVHGHLVAKKVQNNVQQRTGVSVGQHKAVAIDLFTPVSLALRCLIPRTPLGVQTHTHFGFVGLQLTNLEKRTCAIGAHPIGAPGCPELARWTTSAARVRIVLIAVKSMGVIEGDMMNMNDPLCFFFGALKGRL